MKKNKGEKIKKEKKKKNVLDHLYWDDRVNASDVRVEVDEGKVILTGSVPTYNAKTAAFLDACRVSGVESIENEIEVNFPNAFEGPKDSEIKNNIEDLLSWNSSIDASKIDVFVKDGIVNLKGSVDAYWKKLEAEKTAARINGVVNMKNKIVVVPSQDREDREIAEEIIHAIARDVRVSVDNVDVTVNGGKATLSGTVDAWIAHDAAVNAAKHTEGIKEIQDDIVIQL